MCTFQIFEIQRSISSGCRGLLCTETTIGPRLLPLPPGGGFLLLRWLRHLCISSLRCGCHHGRLVKYDLDQGEDVAR